MPVSISNIVIGIRQRKIAGSHRGIVWMAAVQDLQAPLAGKVSFHPIGFGIREFGGETNRFGQIHVHTPTGSIISQFPTGPVADIVVINNDSENKIAVDVRKREIRGADRSAVLPDFTGIFVGVKILLVSFEDEITFPAVSPTDNPSVIAPVCGGAAKNIEVILDGKASGNTEFLVSCGTIRGTTPKFYHSAPIWTAGRAKGRGSNHRAGISAIATLVIPRGYITSSGAVGGTIGIEVTRIKPKSRAWPGFHA